MVDLLSQIYAIVSSFNDVTTNLIENHPCDEPSRLKQVDDENAKTAEEAERTKSWQDLKSGDTNYFAPSPILLLLYSLISVYFTSQLVLLGFLP